MKGLLKSIPASAYIVVLLLGFSGYQWFRADIATVNLEARNAELNDIRGKYNTAQERLASVRAKEQEKREALKRHQAQQQKLAATASERLQTIRRLQHEIDSLREWSGRPLPDFIIGLHDHPTFTASADYLKHLHHSQPVHTSGDKPEE